MPDWTAYQSIAAVLLVAAALGAVGYRFRQPLIISFLLAGVLVGPSGLRVIGQHTDIALLAQIGISLLLFVVGLRLDLGMIRTVGPVALATGLGQVLFTSSIGLVICLAMGMSLTGAAYVAVALTFSSTIIVVKLLSDKKEIDALHGRIAVGFLIVQDICAILAMIGLTALGGAGHEDQSVAREVAWIVGKGLAMLGVMVVLMRWVLPSVLAWLARSQELLVVFAITWAILCAAAAEALGFSKEVGAFLGGVSLASAPQRDAIAARLVVMRDFLLLFFFLDLGARLELGPLTQNMGKAAILSAFVLIGNPLIVLAIMGGMGYHKRTGFMCGLTVAQISEFSLILAALGMQLGHIDQGTLSLVTLVGLVTIFASTYLILYSGWLYERMQRWLGFFERSRPYREAAIDGAAPAGLSAKPVILLGVGNYGRELATHLRNRGRSVLAVDFDPDALRHAVRDGCVAVYGDVGDPEVLSQLPLSRAEWIVCSIRERVLGRTVLRLLKEAGYNGPIAVAARSPSDTQSLRAAGATVVLETYSDAAEQAAETLTGAVHVLPGLMNWPAAIREMALKSGSIFAGKMLREVPLRQETGASVLAVSRAGRVHFNPPPDFRLFPGDRLAVLGDPASALRAVEYLDLRELGRPQEDDGAFAAAEITVSEASPCAGRTLAQLEFRSQHGLTVIGIRRGQTRLASPRADEVIAPLDHLIVVGSREAVDRASKLSPL